MKIASLRKRISSVPGSIQVVVAAPGGTRHYPVEGIEFDQWNMRLIVGLPVDDKQPYHRQVRKAVAPTPADARSTSLAIPSNEGEPCFTLGFPEGRDYAVDIFSSEDGRLHRIHIERTDPENEEPVAPEDEETEGGKPCE